MKLYAALTLLFVLLTSSAFAKSASYYIPPAYAQTSIVISEDEEETAATFTNTTGSFRFNRINKSISNLLMAVDARSLTASPSHTLKSMRRDLQTSTYEEITFKQSNKVVFNEKDVAIIKGTLSLKGLDHEVELIATLKDKESKNFSINLKSEAPLSKNDKTKKLQLTFKLRAIKT